VFVDTDRSFEMTDGDGEAKKPEVDRVVRQDSSTQPWLPSDPGRTGIEATAA